MLNHGNQLLNNHGSDLKLGQFDLETKTMTEGGIRSKISRREKELNGIRFQIIKLLHHLAEYLNYA